MKKCPYCGTLGLTLVCCKKQEVFFREHLLFLIRHGDGSLPLEGANEIINSVINDIDNNPQNFQCLKRYSGFYE